MSKKNVQVLHTSDSRFVIGEVVDVAPGSIVLRQPLVINRHPALSAIFLSRYHQHGNLAGSEITFLTSSLISYSVPDKETKKLYRAGVKGMKDAEKSDKEEPSKYTIIRPGDRVSASNQTQEASEDENISIDELRRTTVRVDD